MNNKFKNTEPHIRPASDRQIEETYQYFEDIDIKRAQMTAKEIDLLQQAEKSMYGNPN